MKKEDVLNFISDLVFPVEPAVFAGYGTQYQREYTECMASGDPGQCLWIEEKHIADLIDNNINELLDIMLDIFANKPKEYANSLPVRREEDWDYYVNLVISCIAKRAPDITMEKLNCILLHTYDKRRDIIEILSFMDSNEAYSKLKEIKNCCENLSEEEAEMITEVEKEFMESIECDKQNA